MLDESVFVEIFKTWSGSKVLIRCRTNPFLSPSGSGLLKTEEVKSVFGLSRDTGDCRLGRVSEGV